MRLILENIVFELQKAGGISVYWAELLFRMNEKHSSELIFFGEPNENIFRRGLTGLVEEAEPSLFPVGVRRYLPFLKKLEKGSIFHSSYYRFSIQSDVATVTTVHDFTYEYFTKGISRFVHSAQKRAAVRHSAGIICVSENTKRDLLKFYPEIDPSRVRVIYNGVSGDFYPIGEISDIPNCFEVLSGIKFLIFVGDRSSYKNFDKVVDVLLMNESISLVIVGGKAFSEEESGLLSSLAGRVFHFRGVTGPELNYLYNKAFCLVYPSSYEGFGIPVIEAMKAGCPVIAANRSSIPEIAGDAALLVDDITAHAISSLVEQLDDPVVRKQHVEKGFSQASKFSWDKCFEETYAFYKEVYERKFF
ncbi:glycosyltransferase family 4 protein [Shewanella decolorationis]|uniref:glycosyltransferase family 4 protein n=1 Tax=Shewanella decolorationis TaxID=256839 RepID=UPI001ABEE8AE|nr:glycosyltransferase family 1 protein [Shewanella decolorationis]QDZ90403.4 glycosyltransferase family 4 protein [Shewanella decolorationis]